MSEPGKNPAERVCARIEIDGRVQGVAYRWSMQSEAIRQGVCGWVRNQPDGTVAALVMGSRDAVEATVAWCRRGPAAAQVSRVSVAWSAPEGDLQDFEIRY